MTRPVVLIVDDELGHAEVLADLLDERGYDPLVAINGRLALARMAERRPDVVLLDHMMPVLDGADTLAAMRRDPELADIPVIAMSALQNVPIEGAQAYLRKPFSLPELFATLERLTRRGPSP